MIDSAVFGQRAAAFLDERVWCAVPVTSGPHPRATSMGTLVLVLLVRPFLPGWWQAALIALALGASLLILLWRNPNAVVARTDTELVVLHAAVLSSSKPTKVLERFALDVPRAIGPTRWGCRPLNLSYQRYWVADLYGYLVEWMVEMSAPVPPPFRGADPSKDPRSSIS